MNSRVIDFADDKTLRSKAEEKLKEDEQRKAILDGEADMKKLLHELQVHQIELEMQNEELKLAREAAEAALKNYTLLFDLSPMGYFTLDSQGSICELNFTGAEMLGERRFSLLNSNFKLFISDESGEVFNMFLEKIYSTYARESCEVQLKSQQNPSLTVYIEGIVTEEDQKCFISVFDVSRFIAKNKEK